MSKNVATYGHYLKTDMLLFKVLLFWVNAPMFYWDFACSARCIAIARLTRIVENKSTQIFQVFIIYKPKDATENNVSLLQWSLKVCACKNPGVQQLKWVRIGF